MSDCNHADFEAQVDVTRLMDSGNYAADVSIKCAHCSKKFCFIGAPAGLSFVRPMVNVDGTQLRCPIEPEGDEKKLHTRLRFEIPYLPNDNSD